MRRCSAESQDFSSSSGVGAGGLQNHVPRAWGCSQARAVQGSAVTDGVRCPSRRAGQTSPGQKPSLRCRLLVVSSSHLLLSGPLHPGCSWQLRLWHISWSTAWPPLTKYAPTSAWRELRQGTGEALARKAMLLVKADLTRAPVLAWEGGAFWDCHTACSQGDGAHFLGPTVWVKPLADTATA